ncbi:MAG: cytochrome P450 [Acidimicrobiia bacterium]
MAKQLADLGIDPSMMTGGGGNLQTNEGPDHARFRRVVSRWFTPRAVDRMRPLVRARTEELLAPLTDTGGGDFMRDVSARVPGPVFCWMMGADPAAGDRLFSLAEILLKAFDGNFDDAEVLLGAAAEMQEFVEALAAEKKAEPDGQLMSVLLAASDAGEITEADVRSLSFEMLSASTDNTAHSMAGAMTILAEHPDEYERLRADRSLIPSAVEECLRLVPRVVSDPHYTEHGTTLLGVEIPPDTMVHFHSVVGNVDPSIYPDPEVFDIGREHARPQLNFGVGRHYCLGAALARMEMQEILDTVCDAWSSFTVDNGAEIETTVTLHIESLPLSVTPA